MKFTCPRCGRNTEIEEDIGDFPVRCHRCATLLRRKKARFLDDAETQDGSDSRWQSLPALAGMPTPPRGGLRRGMLADMLGARPGSEEAEPTVVHARWTPRQDAPEEAHPVLSRETRRVVRHVKARQQRVRRAVLEGSRTALGALGWVGLVVVGLLGIGVLVLQVQGAAHR